MPKLLGKVEKLRLHREKNGWNICQKSLIPRGQFEGILSCPRTISEDIINMRFIDKHKHEEVINKALGVKSMPTMRFLNLFIPSLDYGFKRNPIHKSLQRCSFFKWNTNIFIFRDSNINKSLLASKLDRGKSWEQNLSVLWVIPSLALHIELSLLMPTIDKTHNCFSV